MRRWRSRRAGARRAARPAARPRESIEELWSRGEAAFEAGDLDAALRLFDAALARDPRRARSWNYVGGAHFAQGDLARALEEFRRAVELDPRDVRACNNLGTALERLGDYARRRGGLRARPCASTRRTRSPSATSASSSRGGSGNPDAARRAWQRYLELAPDGPYAARSARADARRARDAHCAPAPAPRAAR